MTIEAQLKDSNTSPDVMHLSLMYEDVNLPEIVYNICNWAEARNITAEGGATSYSQIPKLLEEVLEFRDAETEEEAKLEFGDILVVCIQIARLRGLDMVECLELAYEKISKRTGTMIDGRFVKDAT